MKYLIIWIVLARSVFSIHCPEYCECHMQNGYRYVGCINKGLISIDLDVPSSVQWLHLTNNSIHSLQNHAFSDLKLVEIQQLDLNRNALSIIDHKAFEGMDVLESLDLSNNHLYHLDPRMFELNPNLKKLDLSSNPLQSLSEPFLVSSSLESIYLKNINLGYLPQDPFAEMTSLKLIDLSKNQLIKFPASSVQSLSNLAQIFIFGNHISCEQYNLMNKDLQNKGIHIYSENRTCPLEIETELNETSTELLSVTMKNNYTISGNRFERIMVDPETIVNNASQTGVRDSYVDSPITTSTVTATNITKAPHYDHNCHTEMFIAILFFSGTCLGALLAYTSVGLYSLYRHQNRRITPDFEYLNLSTVTRPQEPIRNSVMCSTDTCNPHAPPPDYNKLFGAGQGRINC